MATSAEFLAEENAHLQARVQELESQIKPKSSQQPNPDDPSEVAKRIPDRIADDVTRVTRAFLAAGAEQLKVSAESLDKFAWRTSEVSSQHSRSLSDLVANLPKDVFDGVVLAVNHSLDAPARMIQTFYDAYEVPIVPKANPQKPPTTPVPEPLV